MSLTRNSRLAGTKNGNGKRVTTHRISPPPMSLTPSFQQTNSPAKNGDYYPSPSASAGTKKAKVLHTYPSGNSKTRGPCKYATISARSPANPSKAPAYSTSSSHPLAQSALPPTSFHASPLKPHSRTGDDESYASEDAEGESDDDVDGVVDYAAESRARVVPAAGSGEGEFFACRRWELLADALGRVDDDWEGSSDSGD